MPMDLVVEHDMTRESLVSIIIPAYNAEKYIALAIESAIRQTYKNIEIIVVNDGSKDSTVEIVSRYPNVILVSTENKGVSNARNVGIEQSKGEYLFFLDADDELECDAIESLARACIEHRADICCGKYFTDEKPRHEPENDCVIEHETLLQYCIEDNPCTYIACAKLYRRDFIADTRFAVGRRADEDSFFNFELSLKQPKFVIVDCYIYFYRTNENSASHSFNSDSFLDKNQLATIKYDKILKYYPKYKDKARNIFVKSNMASLYKLIHMDTKAFRGYEKECLKYVLENKKHYISIRKFDDKFFFIITHHLYRPMKMFLRIRNFFRKVLM